MKKITAVLTALMLLAGVCNSYTLAADIVEVIYYQNMEGLSADSELPESLSVNDKATLTVDSESYADDCRYNKVLKITGTANYGYLKTVFDEALSFDEEALGANAFAEAEFDAISNSQNFAVKITGNTKKFQEFYIKSNKLFLNNSDNTSSFAIPDGGTTTDWNRYRFIFRLTDADGAADRRLVGVFINGISMGEISSAFDNSQSAFSAISFEVKRAGEYGAVDNISVIKYNSEDGSSLAPDRYSLIKAIKNAKAALEENTDALSEADITAFEEKISTALTSYNNHTLTDDEALAQTEIAAAIPDEILSIVSGGGESDDGENGEDGEKENEDDEVFNRKSFDSFENGLTGNDSLIITQTAPADGTETLISEETEDTADGTIGKYFQIKNSENSSTYPSMKFVFPQISYDADLLGANCFADTEFDIKTFSLTGKSMTIRFADNEYLLENGAKSRRLGLTLTGSSNELKTENESTPVGKLAEHENWLRVRAVMQLTDENGELVKKLVNIYADGKSIMTCEPLELKGNCYDMFAISLSNKKTSDATDLQFGVCIDNFSVTKYNADSLYGDSVNYSELVTAIRTLSENLETGYASGKYEDEYEVIKAEISAAAVLAKSDEALPQKIKAETEKMNTYIKRLKALDMMTASESSICVAECSVLDETLAEKSNTEVSASVFTDKETSAEVTVYSMLFVKKDGFSGGKLIDIKKEDISVPTGGMEEYTAVFDLSTYTEDEKANMFIKLAATSDGEIITNGEHVFFEENETFDLSDTEFSDGVTTVTQFISETERRISLVIKDAAFEKLLVTIKSGDGSIKYFNTVEADKNGCAKIDYAPEAGIDEFSYSVKSDFLNVSDSFIFSEFNSLKSAMERLYAEKSAKCLQEYKDILQVSGAVYDNAVKKGLNIESMLKATLNEKQYDVYSVSEFSASLRRKLSLVYSVITASSADEVKILLSQYENELASSSEYKKLSDRKKQSAATKLLAKKSDIDDVITLDGILDDIIEDITSSSASSSGGSSNGGGGGSRGGIAASMDSNKVVKETLLTKGAKFDDISGVEWAYEAIVALSGMNVINGRSENKFAPNENITREEFVKTAVIAFGLSGETGELKFKDVEKNAWYYHYIEVAVNCGIINGINSESFGTGVEITREDMAVIIHRILKYIGKGITEDGVYIEFTDEESFADYAKLPIQDLAKSGIVNGMGANAFVPKAPCTRAQAVKMIYEAYKRV